MTYRSQAVKSWCLEYQKTKSREAFHMILKRVDDLLRYKIHSLVKEWPHLGNVLFYDLYYTAIVGMAQAALTVRPSHSERRVIQRIASYVQAEIRKAYPLTSQRRFCVFEQLDVDKQNYYMGGRHMQDVFNPEEKTQLAMLRDDYRKMIIDGVVTADEFGMVVRRYAHNRTWKEIGEEYQCRGEYARRKTEAAFKKVQSYFKGWEI